MTKVQITYGGETVVMSWNPLQASANISVNGTSTPYQTADARHDTERAVRLVAHQCWPEAGRFEDGSDEWDELAYETVVPRITISSESVEIGDWGDEDAASVLARFAEFVAERTGAEVEVGGIKTTIEGLDLQPSDIDSALWDQFCGSHNS